MLVSEAEEEGHAYVRVARAEHGWQVAGAVLPLGQ